VLVDQVLDGLEQLLADLGGHLPLPLHERVRCLGADLYLQELGLLLFTHEVEGLEHALQQLHGLRLVHVGMHLAHQLLRSFELVAHNLLMVVVHAERAVHGGEGGRDDGHDVLEILVVRAGVPGGEVLALPVLRALLDLGEHHWQRPQPLALDLHEQKEEFTHPFIGLEQADARHQDGPADAPEETEDAPLDAPLLGPALDQLEHLLEVFGVWNDAQDLVRVALAIYAQDALLAHLEQHLIVVQVAALLVDALDRQACLEQVDVDVVEFHLNNRHLRVLDGVDLRDAWSLAQDVQQRLEEQVARDVHWCDAERVDIGAWGVHAQLLGTEGENLGAGSVVGLLDRALLVACLLGHPVLDDLLELLEHVFAFAGTLLGLVELLLGHDGVHALVPDCPLLCGLGIVLQILRILRVVNVVFCFINVVVLVLILLDI